MNDSLVEKYNLVARLLGRAPSESELADVRALEGEDVTAMLELLFNVLISFAYRKQDTQYH